MIIVRMTGRLGNQMFQYAAGRRLAHALNTELKINYVKRKEWYKLNNFNIQENYATEKDIEATTLFQVGWASVFAPQVLELPDNTYLKGYWENERYFADIADIIRKEFTLKNPLSPVAEAWSKKISSAECAVSMSFRRGDFLTLGSNNPTFAVPPLEYYLTALKQLAEPKPTVFVFSDDLPWCKENVKLDVPTEFVEGCKDYEQLHLISLCKHNIKSNSTFDWWGAWLNQNPDKKVFVPIPNTFFKEVRLYRGFTPTHYKYSPLDSERWIRIPFDMSKKLNNPLPPKDNTVAPPPPKKEVPARYYHDFYIAELTNKLNAQDISNINLTILGCNDRV